MPHPERAGGGPGPEAELPRYSRTARFAGEVPAGHAYVAIEDLLYRTHEEPELSCYRFQLDAVYHVAVLGEPPPRALDRQIARILAHGEPAAVPEDVLKRLNRRRLEQRELGDWVERHHRPGKPLT
jgi:hypothetical protein